ncbi:hypothetical protein BDV96DRAFT_647504 [Lophiotrema nucula]|uniref:Uncharacterized protein n=1 Tax=Lophiotrema nucula TaxID=690887 RepID=A0A6A5Z569_9PLEO|nr:hypothetical protein BDV96DRAFT_647504 [Lophiotrema nucula]
MADQGEIDPQYLSILPKHFELTPDAKKQVPPWGLLDPDTPEAAIFYLNHLAEPRSTKVSHTASHEDNARQRKEWDEFKEAHPGVVTKLHFNVFFQRKIMLQSLQAVGLDVRGGLVRLIQLRSKHFRDGYFPTNAITVTNPEKARKYINIGIQLPSSTPDHPKSLKEASDLYSQISTLVGMNSPTMKDLDKRIEESKDENEKWELKRERFRVQTKERYEKALLDVAREEWLDKELSEIRGKKRARLD